VENTHYTRVLHSRQWSNYNLSPGWRRSDMPRPLAVGRQRWVQFAQCDAAQTAEPAEISDNCPVWAADLRQFVRCKLQLLQVRSPHGSCRISQLDLQSALPKGIPTRQVASPSECFWSSAGCGFVAVSVTSGCGRPRCAVGWTSCMGLWDFLITVV